MESLVAAVVGFVVGLALHDLSGAVALDRLAGLFASQRQSILFLVLIPYFLLACVRER